MDGCDRWWRVRDGGVGDTGFLHYVGASCSPLKGGEFASVAFVFVCNSA